MSALDIIRKLPTAFNPGTAGGDRVIQLNGSQPAYAAITNDSCTITEGVADNANLTLTADDSTIEELLTGKLPGMQAVMTGKLKVQGDMMLAQQIGRIFDFSKLA